MAKKQPAAAAQSHVDEKVVEGNIAGVVNNDGKVVPLSEMPEDELRALAVEMGIDPAGKTKEEVAAAIAAEQVEATEAEVVEHIDVVEPADQAGVETIESPAFPGTDDDRTIGEVDAQIKAANAYTVASPVKAGGKRYEIGDVFPAELLVPALLASGAVVKA